ncbi:MAG: ADP-ribosylglycohydrolase family protein [Clostridiales bacterium]|nr:ADP-ribosylglycohydrolase family protein [Clostridiales bacterium]
MDKKKVGMVLGGFVGDAFSLAPHWIYSIEQINQLFGNLENIVDLPMNTYHTKKKKGDFTHYGDQMLWLLQFSKTNNTFNKELYTKFWVEKMTKHSGYIDHASRETLNRLKQKNKEGGLSLDMSGAVMIGPMIYFNKEKIKNLLKAINKKISITHNQLQVLKTGRFMTEVILEVLKGQTPINAITSYMKKLESNDFLNISFEKANRMVKELPQEVIVKLGQSCGVESALPSTLYLLLKYQDDFRKAIIENTKAGGDSAARGIMIGTILGAYHGIDGIPKKWLSDMNTHSEILRLLS